MKCVIATTTNYRTVDEVRARLALRFAEEAKRYGYRLAVVDGDSPQAFRDALSERGACIFPEPRGGGMGASRRQALIEAREFAGPDGVVAWVEPEKWPLVANLGPALACFDQGADLVVPARTEAGFLTYPSEQMWAEYIGNRTFRKIAGVRLDAWFGPKLMNREALKRFLDYSGTYGDRWESLLIPVLACIKDGLKVVSAQVVYGHPPEQTAAEGTIEMTMLRIEQIRNIVPALQAAALHLGL